MKQRQTRKPRDRRPYQVLCSIPGGVDVATIRNARLERQTQKEVKKCRKKGIST
jgi:hypothetical protein